MNLRNLGALLVALIVAALPVWPRSRPAPSKASSPTRPAPSFPARRSRRAASGASCRRSPTPRALQLPRPSPGNYTISANLTGFTSVKVPDVRLTLGQTLKVDLALRVSTIQEEVTVTGEAPVVDVTSTARSTSIRDEFIDNAAQGPRLHDPGHPGPGREHRVQDRRPLDRRRVLVREQVHHRRHRDQRPRDRPQQPAAGHRHGRRGPGQVERLRGRVLGRGRRRRQRRHQVRHQRLQGLRVDATTPATRSASRAAPRSAPARPRPRPTRTAAPACA